MRNIDLRIGSFGFNSCPILMIGCSIGDFCNTFWGKAELTQVDFDVGE